MVPHCGDADGVDEEGDRVGRDVGDLLGFELVGDFEGLFVGFEVETASPPGAPNTRKSSPHQPRARRSRMDG